MLRKVICPIVAIPLPSGSGTSVHVNRLGMPFGLVHLELIEVDGGVNPKNAWALGEAGAGALVAGNAIFGAGDYEKAISEIRAAAEEGARSAEA